MNARFGAVALSSCLSVMLVSQLFPLPSLTSLVEANKRSRTPLAVRHEAPEDNAVRLAQAPQALGAPQALQAPQASEVAQALQPPQAIEVPQSAEPPRMVEAEAAQAIELPPANQLTAMSAPDPVAAPDVADAAPSSASSEAAASLQAAEAPHSTEPQPPAVAMQVSEATQAPTMSVAPAGHATAAGRDAAEATEPASTVTADKVATRDEAQAPDENGTETLIASADRSEMLPAAPSSSQAEPALTGTADKVATADETQAADQTEAKMVIASADPSEMLPATPSSSQAEPASTPASELNGPADSVGVSAVTDECFVMDICVDRYLWTLYQRAPKEDTIRVPEQRQVTIKRKRKWVTVTRTFFRSEDEDFAWKDRKAAEKAGLPMPDYVIGGMDREFKLKLFYALHAAEAAGLSPGITSAFRDDYRQSIASGLKAASNKSYHGGSLRGGYGHGLAADIISTNGATRAERWTATEALWKWVDAHGRDFGIGRPYLSYDPPHVGPIDGQEYISRRGGGGTIQQADAAVKPRKHLTARHEGHATKRAHHIASAQGSKVRSARNVHARAT